MTRFFILLLSATILVACTEEGKYPLSGEECTAQDPVQEMTTADCAALPAASGSF